ncbi:hypothetical protein BH18ACI2_BH18ACI2_16060 [soil metagenome]
MNKQECAAHYDRYASRRDQWKQRNRYYHQTIEQLCQSFIPPGKTVLELGSSTGDLLAAVRPRVGVGVDLSRGMNEIARQKYPEYYFIQADAEQLPLREKFDYVIMSDLIGQLSDVWAMFRQLTHVCAPHTQVIITSYNFLWQPVLDAAEKLKLKMPQQYQNWLGPADLATLFHLTNFAVVESGTRLLVPKQLPAVAAWANRRLLGGWLDRAALLNYFVVRPAAGIAESATETATCSVIVPCRN